MTRDEMQADILTHATALGVSMRYKHGMPVVEAHAHLEEPAVCAPPVTDAGVYAVVLHELGHIATEPVGYDRESPNLSTMLRFDVATREDVEAAIALEEAAWAWARTHALAWLPEMAEQEARALATYTTRRAQARRLPNPFALAALSMSAVPSARAWARRRVLTELAQLEARHGDQGALRAAIQRRLAAFDARQVAA